MSDPVKPEDTQPVVAEQSAPKPEEIAPVAETTSEPAVTTTATTGVDDVTPVVDKPAGEAVEGKKEEEKLEPQEITKGTLSKLHSGLLSFFKRERFFYFSEDALSEERLKTYLHRDNASVANAAYATQTGKGLLFYSKQEGHVPHGIIKLADVTEILPIGLTKFDLKLPAGDLHFESPTNRDSWVFTLGQKVAEAKAAQDEVINSDGYKAAIDRLTKPTAVVAGKAPAEAKEKEKEKEPEETEKAKKVEGSTADNEAGPSGAVKRSVSKGKKRVSVLRGLLNRKEEKEEHTDKKEEPVEKKEDTPEESKAGEPTTATTTTTTTNAPPVTDAPEEAKDVKPSEEAGTSTEPAAGPTKKRQSIFSPFIHFKKEKETEEKKEKEPETVVKTEPEAGTKPIDTPVASASTEKAERTSTSSPPKPKFSSFFERRKAEKEPEAKSEDVKPAETTTEPVPVPGAATDTATPAEGASAADSPSPATSPKERRLSSFFAFGKEKKDGVKSDSEEAEPSSPKPSTSPANFVVGLYRRASKAGRSSPKETEAKEVVAPATVPEEIPAVTTVAETETPNGTEGTAEPAAPTEPASAIGDVIAEAVNVGQAPPVQAAA